MFPAFKESPVVLTSKIALAFRDGSESWNNRVDYRTDELEGLRLCLVGFGGTGRCIDKRAAGFDMKMRSVNIYPMQGIPEVRVVESIDALLDCLAEADVVAVCLPLTSATEEMFTDEHFGYLKPGAFLINVTRGEIIDHQALLRALESGRLRGAGLDVHYKEPLPSDYPLWSNTNVVMTPHTAGASQLQSGLNYERFVENVGRFYRGEPLLGEVDNELGF